MSTHKSSGVIWGVIAVIAVFGAWFAVAGETTSTLANLQTAFNGESNACARYQAFALKAAEDGYPGAASLFRAASRAEEIHAANHAKVIAKLEAKPEATVETPDVKTTVENLQAALAGESYERDNMYPPFLEQARVEGNADAGRTFNFARAAETEHAALYAQVLNDPTAWKSGPRDFYVCPVCGKTVSTLDFGKCPVCFTPRDKFEKIS